VYGILRIIAFLNVQQCLSEEKVKKSSRKGIAEAARKQRIITMILFLCFILLLFLKD